MWTLSLLTMKDGDSCLISVKEFLYQPITLVGPMRMRAMKSYRFSLDRARRPITIWKTQIHRLIWLGKLCRLLLKLKKVNRKVQLIEAYSTPKRSHRRINLSN